MTQALLRQVEAQRNGESVDQTLMKGIIQSYGKLAQLPSPTQTRTSQLNTHVVSLGIDETDAQRQVLNVYSEFFQTPFIAATVQYYHAESAAYIENNSVADYMRKAEGRLDEEMKRVDMYLHDSTRNEVSSLIIGAREVS